ncbi:hypothetical protein V1477_020097 [Vespula maculifrons]|uniref:Uncharacterized protein n=1 Tax=Vespula maculifrons TaxID=7453 RepID=A0ABD2AKY2_VESMC
MGGPHTERSGPYRTVPYTIHPDHPNEGPSGTDVPAPGFGRSRSSCVSSVNIVTAIVVIIFRRTRPPALNEITPSGVVDVVGDSDSGGGGCGGGSDGGSRERRLRGSNDRGHIYWLFGRIVTFATTIYDDWNSG